MLSYLPLALAFLAATKAQDNIAAESIYYSQGGCNPVSRSGGVIFTPNTCQKLTASGLGLGTLTSVNLTFIANASCSGIHNSGSLSAESIQSADDVYSCSVLLHQQCLQSRPWTGGSALGRAESLRTG